MTNRQRFLDACRCQSVDRPPVWLMRQAGRALPEYRALKEKFSFLQLVQTPELAAEVTLQPIRRFDFDAAILFSDILVAAEGLGQDYKFRDGGGIQMDFALRTPDDFKKLDGGGFTEKLDYIPRALRLVKKELAGKTALIGFAGSPWTLANFMLEGGSVEKFTKAKMFFDSDKKTFCALMEKLAAAVAKLLQMQIDAGADAVQIFDSLANLLPPENFQEASARWMKQIISQLNPRVPIIVFSRGQNSNWQTLIETGANILGIDSSVKLADIRRILPPQIGLQGNLEPTLLTTTPEKVAAETEKILTEMRDTRGHIFNLGHGVPPDAKLENLSALVETVKNFK
ncbi:MAG TPA: uroporphyrinogen decarboxylase [Verrucomicrobiae bacterium]